MKSYLKISLLFLIVFIFSVCVFAENKKKISADIDLLRSYTLMQDYQKVIPLCENLLQAKLSKKRKYFVLCNMAQAYGYLKKFELAVEKGQEAEDLYKNKIEPKMILGNIYKENTLYELANEKFLEVLELDGDNINALIELGNVNKINENYKDALAYYTEVSEMKQDLNEDFYLNMAECAKELGYFAQAQQILEDVYIKNKSKKTAIKLSYAYRKQERYDDAQKVLAPFTSDKSSYDTEIYSNLALVYILSKEYEKAKNLLETFCANSTDTEMISLLLAEAYFELSDKRSEKIIENLCLNSKSQQIKKYAKMMKVVFKKHKM